MSLTPKEITIRLYGLAKALMTKTDKRICYGGLGMTIRNDMCVVYLNTDYEVQGGHSYGTAKGDTPEAALADADRIIAALPDLNTAKLHSHMARVAACIDKAHADGIADEYVTPLRVTVKAMSDNLLAAPPMATTEAPRRWVPA